MTALDDILNRLRTMPQEEKAALIKESEKATSDAKFVPNPGPQTQAYLSQADVLLYGGQAGGGKTLLELGWAVNEAQNSIIFRRERTQTDGLEREGKTLIGLNARFNGQDLEWTWPTGKTLKLAGMQLAGDWISHAGRERDYMGFDEAGEFLEMQVAQIGAWLRAPPGRRTRMILGSNPPRSADGLWLIKWFAPWLDRQHPKPAVQGELRWAVHISRGDEIEVHWVDGPGEYAIGDDTYIAKSYTFIPASLTDNPFRDTPEYRAQLQSLPEPLRSQLLYGKFSASLKDLANQIIPTAWVQLAQQRWTANPPRGTPMCAMAVDCSGGGHDPMIIARRYDGWYAPLIEVPGKDIPVDRAGSYAAGIVVSYRRDKAAVTVDMGGGYGGSVYEHLMTNEVEAVRYLGAAATTKRSVNGGLRFTNKRSAALWTFREALDPDQPGGSPIALPDDQRLMADLTAPTYRLTPNGIQAEDKTQVCARLGRSTDRGDAVVMAWFEGPRRLTHGGDWLNLHETPRGLRSVPQLITSGRQPLSAQRRM